MGNVADEGERLSVDNVDDALMDRLQMSYEMLEAAGAKEVEPHYFLMQSYLRAERKRQCIGDSSSKAAQALEDAIERCFCFGATLLTDHNLFPSLR